MFGVTEAALTGYLIGFLFGMTLTWITEKSKK